MVQMWCKPVWVPGSSARLRAPSLHPTQAQRKPRSANPVGFTIHCLIFKMDESACLRAWGVNRATSTPALRRRLGGGPA